jgi:hypothetical protein
MGYKDKVAIKILKKSFLKNKREFFRDKDTGSKYFHHIYKFNYKKIKLKFLEMIYKNAL